MFKMVEKKQLMIILPFLDHLSFETRNRLNSCIRNQLPSCSLRIAFQSKIHLSSLFKFKESIPKYLREYINISMFQMVEKKQLMIILPFLGHLSFETRNRLNSCIRNQLPSCSLRIAFQSKICLSSLFKFKESIPKYLRSHLIYKFSCSCCNAT